MFHLILPTSEATSKPSLESSSAPSLGHSVQLSKNPSSSSVPSFHPSSNPSSLPSSDPSYKPTSKPTDVPSFEPSKNPTTQPSFEPSSVPTNKPSNVPSIQPSNNPSTKPSYSPSFDPSSTFPSFKPTLKPSLEHSYVPSVEHSSKPTSKPSLEPTSVPTTVPSSQPTSKPSLNPSLTPSFTPSFQPTVTPCPNITLSFLYQDNLDEAKFTIFGSNGTIIDYDTLPQDSQINDYSSYTCCDPSECYYVLVEGSFSSFKIFDFEGFVAIEGTDSTLVSIGNCPVQCENKDQLLMLAEAGDGLKYYEGGALVEDKDFAATSVEIICMDSLNCQAFHGSAISGNKLIGSLDFILTRDGVIIEKGSSLNGYKVFGSVNCNENCDLKPILTATVIGTNIISVLSTISNLTSFQDLESTQYKAACWIIKDDSRALISTHPSLIQRYIIALFYHATNGSNWFNQSNFLTIQNECDWSWISCSVDKEITELKLQVNNLVGEIPTELGTLTSLEYLSLSSNKLYGTIPVTIGNLISLKELDLHNNKLDGSIPTEVGSMASLEVMLLNENDLQGSIPSFYNLERLQTLSFKDNQLSWISPRNIGNITILENCNDTNNLLYFYSDALVSFKIFNTTGHLIDSDSEPSYSSCDPDVCLYILLESSFANYKLQVNEDTIKEGNLYQKSTLFPLDSCKNQCDGGMDQLFLVGEAGEYARYIGGDLVEEFQFIQPRVLRKCVDPEICNALIGNVECLITRNGAVVFDGSKTDKHKSFGSNCENYCDKKPDLKETVRGNAIFNTISTISTNAELQDLDSFHYEAACWIIHDDLLNLAATDSSLLQRYVLTLFYYKTQGSLWNNKYNFLSFTSECNWNEFDGVFCNEDGNVTHINLRKNNLVGGIPEELSELERIKHLLLEENLLSGTIPTSLGYFSSLEQLFLNNNTIGGTLPSELGQLLNLQTLRLDENQLSGTVPISLVMLNKLEVLSLRDNLLSGNIQKYIGNVTFIEYCNPDNLLYLLSDGLINYKLLSNTGVLIDSSSETSASSCYDPNMCYYVYLESDEANFVLRSNEELIKTGNIRNTSTLFQIGPCSYDECGTEDQLIFMGEKGDDYVLYENGVIAELGLFSETSVKTSCVNPTKSCYALIGNVELLVLRGGAVLFDDRKSRKHKAFATEYCETYCDQKPDLLEFFRGQDILDALSFLSESSKLQNLESSRYKAACWIIYDDLRQLNVNNSSLAQRYILALFYHSTKGINWGNQNNFLNGVVSECMWNLNGYGIGCNLDDEVTDTKLPNNNLEGEIPSEFGRLTALKYLSVEKNNLNGTIPSQIGMLKDLESLYLFENSLTGTIPNEISALSKLESLRLDENDLSATVPSSIVMLKELQTFSVKGNSLTGEIPKSIGNVTLLEFCDLNEILYFYSEGPIFYRLFDDNRNLIDDSSNSLTSGTCYDSAKCYRLLFEGNSSYHFKLFLNDILVKDGELLQQGFTFFSIGSCTHECSGTEDQLYFFGDVGSNYVVYQNGNLIENGNFSDSSLKTTCLDRTSCHSLVGYVASLLTYGNDVLNEGGRTDRHKTFKADYCERICDEKPSLYGSLRDQKIVDILSTISGMENFENDTNYLFLETDRYETACWLIYEDSYELYFDESLIQRFVFALLYIATHGKDWSSQYNFLSEDDECSWHDSGLNGVSCDISGNAIRIKMNENNIIGTLPEEIAQFTFLEHFEIEGNFLKGNIPTSIAECKGLVDLSLSKNQFTGTIPNELGNLEELQVLKLFENEFTGTLPSSLGSLSKMNNLLLYDNKFNGSLSSIISNFEELQTISLRKNQFVDDISITSIGNLTFLEYCDLDNLFYFYSDGIVNFNLFNSTGHLIDSDRETSYSTCFDPATCYYILLESNYSNIKLLNNEEVLIETIIDNETNLFTMIGPCPHQCSQEDQLFIIGEAGTEYVRYENGILIDYWLFTNSSARMICLAEEYCHSFVGNIEYLITRNEVFVDQGSKTEKHKVYGANNCLQICDEKPLLTNSLRGQYIVDVLSTVSGYYYFDDDLDDLESVRYKVACWLIYDDPLSLNSFDQSLLQRYILTLMFYMTQGFQWSEQYNFLSEKAECDWRYNTDGIVCRGDGNVTEINLDNNNLSGEIPIELGNLSSVEQLILSRNSLSGTIPISIGYLTNMSVCYIHDNELTASVPTTISGLENLKGLSLHGNDLIGNVSHLIGNLELLEYCTFDYLFQLYSNGDISYKLYDSNGYLIDSSNTTSHTCYNPNECYHLLLVGNGDAYYKVHLNEELIKEGYLDNNNSSFVRVGSCFDVCGTMDQLTFVGEIGELYRYYMDGNLIEEGYISESAVKSICFRSNHCHSLIGELAVLWTFNNSVILEGSINDGYQVYYEDNCEEICHQIPSLVEAGTRGKEITDILSTISQGSIFEDTESSQYKASCWLINDDIRQVQPSDTNLIQRYVLALFYYQTGGPKWSRPTKFLSPIKECKWRKSWRRVWSGVDCDKYGNVNAIFLSDTNLVGQIPTELLVLLKLESLSLNDNSLKGTVPSKIGNLNLLSRISLWKNDLSGSIPFSIGSLVNLEILQLYDNKFIGSIPTTIGYLENLVELTLYQNDLKGSVPTTIINLKSLQTLSLRDNPDLTGTLPNRIGNLTLFEFCDLNQIFYFYSNPFSLTHYELFDGTYGHLIDSKNQTSETCYDATKCYLLLLEGYNSHYKVQYNEEMVKVKIQWNRVREKEGLLEYDSTLVPFGTCPHQCGRLEQLVFTGNMGDNYSFYEKGNLIEAEQFSSTSAKIVCVQRWSCYALVGYLASLLTYEEQIVYEGSSFDRHKVTKPLYCKSKCDQKPTIYDPDNGSKEITDVLASISAFEILEKDDIYLFLEGPRYEAACWIIYDDPLNLNHTDYNLLQRYILVLLYKVTNGTKWDYGCNFVTGSKECSWSNDYRCVECDGNGYVEHLRLDDNNLVGTIPSELGHFMNINSLYLNDNYLTGTLPTDIANLTTLEYLYLNFNNITGVIPNTISGMENMLNLSLHENHFIGTIPSFVGNLKRLKQLSLHDNFLNGTIPSQIGNLKDLENLYLFNNSLSGTIPFEIGNNKALRFLYFNGNRLTGTIPFKIGEIKALEYFYIFDNNLTGTIFSEIGNLEALQYLSFERNRLTGTIPAKIGNLILLRELVLQNNELSGSIPSSIGNLTELYKLNLAHNLLDSTVPTTIASMGKLYFVYLNDNQLTGSIPSIFNSFKNLKHLHLQNNSFDKGFIPDVDIVEYYVD